MALFFQLAIHMTGGGRDTWPKLAKDTASWVLLPLVIGQASPRTINGNEKEPLISRTNAQRHKMYLTQERKAPVALGKTMEWVSAFNSTGKNPSLPRVMALNFQLFWHS